MDSKDLQNNNEWKKYFRMTIVGVIILLFLFGLYNARNEYYEYEKIRTQVDLSLYKAISLQNTGSFLEARGEYEGILNNISSSRFPDEYVLTQNNLGYIYQNLAQVEDEEENLKKAINAYRKSLGISTKDNNLIDRGQTYNDIGDAYRDLAGLTDKIENLEKAINAYKETLKMRPVDTFPIEYATIQNNLGIAYRMMAEERDVEPNLKKAFDAHYQALMIFNAEKYPTGHATVQNELGNAFRLLAEVKDKDSNLGDAIDAYNEALVIFTEEKYPAKYQSIMLNLERAENQLNNDVSTINDSN
ncbi:MAG: tetratricopeptide repeat protein [Candidatus Methanoperedens sp.]|nr:tetratricopeptide repeat protein [Candidatus Methanoperedens sp.]